MFRSHAMSTPPRSIICKNFERYHYKCVCLSIYAKELILRVVLTVAVKVLHRPQRTVEVTHTPSTKHHGHRACSWTHMIR